MNENEQIFIKGREVASKKYVDTKVANNSSSTYTIIDRGTSKTSLKTGFNISENAETLRAFFKETLKGKRPTINILTTHTATLLSNSPDRVYNLDYYSITNTDTQLTYSFVYQDVETNSQGQHYGVWVRDHVEFDLRISYNTSTEAVSLVNYTYNKQYLLKNNEDILGKDNVMAFTPTGDYNPATKKYVDDKVLTAIAGVTQFSLVPVDTLPTENIRTDVIYAIPSDNPQEQNVRVEYVYVNGNWEILGNTNIDLTNYYTKSEIDAMITTNSDIDALFPSEGAV